MKQTLHMSGGTHLKSIGLMRMSKAVLKSRRYSSLGLLSRSLIGRENIASHVTNTDDSGMVRVSSDENQRLET